MLNRIKKKLNSGMGKDVVWTFSLQIAIMLCSFCINKILASRLSIDDFGQYNVIKRSVQVLSLVMLAGVGIAIPRYIPRYRNSNPPQRIAPLLSAALIYIICVSTLVLLFCISFSSLIQNIIIGEANNLGLMLVALTYAFILALAQYAFAYYRGTSKFKWYNGSQLAMQLLITLPLLLLPCLTVNNVFISWLLMTAILVVYLLGRETRHYVRQNGSFPFSTHVKSHLITITKYSSGRLVADFFQFSLSAFPLIYISNVLGLQPTAYFSVGITLVTMVTPLYSFIGIILLPYVSEAMAQHKLASANRYISRLTMLYIGSSLLLTVFMYLLIRFLILIFFAEEYVVTSDISRIIVFSIMPQALFLLYRNTIDAVSSIPYNAITLSICFAAIALCFHFCTSLTQFAYAYLAVSCLQGLLSFITWQIVKKK